MTALRQLAEKVKDEMLKDPHSPFNECAACGRPLARITFCGSKLVGCTHCRWYADA